MPGKYWQENEVRFDVSSSHLLMCAGENILEKVEPVEDTKANSGDCGSLVMTNLRIMWYSTKTAKLNLTIGYNCLVTISSKSSTNRRNHPTLALYLLAKTGNGKFEFLFTPLGNEKKDFSATLTAIHKSYIASKPFRELRLRHHIVHANQLKTLPLEQICNRIDGVWNLASNQGNLGCFIITNIRVVWFATLNEYFNISLPYLQIAQFSIRDSKFGQVLVIESTEASGGYILGFRVDPASRLKQLLQEIQSLHMTQIRNPELGVNWNPSSAEATETDMPHSVEFEKEDEGAHCFANYLLGELELQSCEQSEFDRSIGLAMEKLPIGVNRLSLWQLSF